MAEPIDHFAAAEAAAAQQRVRAMFKKRLTRAAYVPGLVMLAVALLTGVAVNQLLDRARWVDHTHAVIAQANRCFLLTVDLQSGLRGYQLTGATNFLAPYFAAREASDTEWGRLEALISDNPAQQQRLRLLRAKVGEFIEFSEQVIRLREAGADVLNLPLNEESKGRFDELRARFREVISAEEALLAPRATAFSSFTSSLLTGRFAVALLIAVLLGLFITRQLRTLNGSYEVALDELAASVGRAAEETRSRLETERLNDRLKEVDRLKSQFLATMSHELRTPLNSIIGFTEIILAGLAGPVNPEQQKQLSMVLNSARHLLQLINDLLDLARIESGRVEPIREPFQLRDVIAQVLATLKPLAAAKRLPIETEFRGETAMVSDRKMVFQILLNLANNAVKFTERGKVRIETEGTDGWVQIRVSDTGIGIKPENLSLLFEAFRQVDGSARRRFEGTGLGLYLSKQLVTLLGGEIKVESVFEQGSAFTVRLPAASEGKQ